MSKKLTNNEFIEKARKIHGDKYDYSKVNYIDNKTKVTIICPEHGEFLQTPNAHLSGYGCSRCAGIRTTEDFILKARKVHGDKYDYSKVDYKGWGLPVIIICPEHGEFFQIPITHISGCGCSKCAGNIKSSTEEFIEEARKVHGDKYDYSKVNYIDNKTKVTIICPEHGEFLQTPNAHLGGHGCRECSNKRAQELLRSSAEEFIEKARKVHGDKYIYDKVNYINRATNVIITCPEHGDFPQTPSNHLCGAGCPRCAGHIKLTKEEFIKKSREVHGDKYDYSKVNYVDNKNPVTIICPIHGEFEQRPDAHLRGLGCKKCGILVRADKRRLTIEEFVERSRKIHGDKYDYSKVNYIDSTTDVIITCPEHGDFPQNPRNHLYGAGCPRCQAFGLEEAVSKVLTENNIKFEFQKTFPWLKNKSLLFLDFYLPDYNIAIECQGLQHFQSVEYFGGEEGFRYRLGNDKIKLDLCTEHDIKVIYYSDLGIDYPYEVIEDLEQVVQTILNHKKGS